MNQRKAYSFVTIKSLEDKPGERIISGIATTPETDRVGDVVDPMGAVYEKEIPFLWSHDHDQPIGRAQLGTPTRDGIPFTARIANVEEEGELKKRLDLAYQTIKSGLATAVSIGFRPLKGGMKILDSGANHFTKYEVFELSACVIPCNAGAKISAVKAFDQAASGTIDRNKAENNHAAEESIVYIDSSSPQQTTSKSNQKGIAMNYAEQIQSFQKSLSSKQAELDNVLQKSLDEGRTLDQTEEQQYDELTAEVAALEKHLDRLQAREKSNASSAKPVEQPAQGKSHIVNVSKQLPKGLAMARFAKCIAAAKGNEMQAVELAKAHYGDTPQVIEALQVKAAGNTTDAVWAAPLVQETNMVGEFIELLRAQTVMGKLSGFRDVPFNVRVPRQTGGASVGWVGEGQQKPNSELAFDTVSLGFAKIAGIVPITDELLRFSNPSVDAIIQKDLIATMARFIDDAFLDPAAAATAHNPASVTNGAAKVASTGTDEVALKEDLKALVQQFTGANLSLSGAYLLMSESRAFEIGLMETALGQSAFKGMTDSAAGGQRSIFGIPVVTSEAEVMKDRIVLMKPSEILLANDGGVDMDVSREASITLNGKLVSMWENNLVGMRAERFINWTKARDQAVAYIDYTPAPAA